MRYGKGADLEVQLKGSYRQNWPMAYLRGKLQQCGKPRFNLAPTSPQ